ncbi:MAG: beta-propeller fold lactonase family protein [Pirellulaceae bacterium]|nr:beta-propeller fold lactonase family protein [Pirellulaceae bacterium]
MLHSPLLPVLRGSLIFLTALMVYQIFPDSTQGQLVISGNENKLVVGPNGIEVNFNAKPDSITLLDFSQFPPNAQHLHGISNSVYGPPSNIAIIPGNRLALIASSVKLNRNADEGWVPDNIIHILDLTASPPRIVGTTTAGQQPSGLTITPDGQHALVANRAAGTITVFSISGMNVQPVQTVEVCAPEQQLSDVAISPDGKLVLSSVQEGHYLAVLKLDDGVLSLTERRLTACGKPYRTVITPDGSLGLTAGSGQEGPDVNALTVVDLTVDPIRTVDYIPVGTGPESFAVHPNSNLLAVMLFNNANLAEGNPARTEHGLLKILARRGKTFEPVQTLPLGRVTQGVAFTADGKYLVAQCHDLYELRVYSVEGEKVQDTGVRIETPGHPSAIRASR